jgi:2-polyprenyl-3-methyl-5-hydroxy-6-metoxy-1,4-benzoquinol methylase
MSKSLIKIWQYKTWRQRIALDTQGHYTMGYLSLPNEWEHNHLPLEVRGKSFLDVGANDGYFVYEAEKRGATRILATDIYHNGRNGNTGGWNIEGIQILKEYFDSKVEIKPLSIYDLHLLQEKFDIVVCTNVISWLDNMNEALKQLSDICNDTLFLKDGFLTRYDPEPVLQYEKAKSLVAFRANLSYIQTVLQSHGFQHFKIVPVIQHKHFEWQMETFPLVISKNEVAIFDSPESVTSRENKNCEGLWVLAEEGDYCFIRNTGWAKKTDLKLAPRGQKSWLGKMLKSILSEGQYGDYIRRKGLEKYVKSYMVIAKRN